MKRGFGNYLVSYTDNREEGFLVPSDQYTRSAIHIGQDDGGYFLPEVQEHFKER